MNEDTQVPDSKPEETPTEITPKEVTPTPSTEETPAPEAEPIASATETPAAPVDAPTPDAEPIVPTSAPVITQDVAATHSSPGLLVLQWLTYAFWGWTILAVACLTASVFASFIGDNDTGTFTAYTTAAALVLLPISLVADIFYTKHEPIKKTGAATLVMIVHAVIFALFGIAALISIVFSIVTMFVSSSDTTSNQITLYSSLVILLLYAATFMRTLNPEKFRWIPKVFKISMIAIVGTISILGLVGPVAQERVRKNDRLIEQNLSEVVYSINKYVTSNHKLPDNLNQIKVYGDQQKLIDSNVLRYTANTKEPKVSLTAIKDDLMSDTNSTTSDKDATTYYYKICTTFKREQKETYTSYDNSDSDGYSSSVYIYAHPAGEKCYSIKTDSTIY